MNYILLRRRPISLGNTYQHMLNEGYTLVRDELDVQVSTWVRDVIELNEYGKQTTRKEMTQLSGPDRHTGDLITLPDGRKFIKKIENELHS